MHTKVCVVMTVAVVHDHVMTDLKTDAVSVVVSRRDSPNGVAVTVLQKDTSAIIAIQIRAVCPVAIQREILNHNVRRVFTGE